MGPALMTSSNVTSAAGRYPAGARAFPHRELLAIGHLETHEILYLLDEAEQWVELNRQPTQAHRQRLAGLTNINAFFENSTRTLLSFEIAGKRLGADVVNMHAAQSSVKKGETLIDTAMTLNAMRADVIVIRHGSSGAVRLIAGQGRLPGAQRRRRPARASDPGAARRARACARARASGGSPTACNGLKVTICGDILHSRVARSNMLCLHRAGRGGARLRAADADARRDRARSASSPFHDFDAALDGADVVMMLRLQNERMDGQFVPQPARVPPPLRPHARAAGARQARRDGRCIQGR